MLFRSLATRRLSPELGDAAPPSAQRSLVKAPFSAAKKARVDPPVATRPEPPEEDAEMVERRRRFEEQKKRSQEDAEAEKKRKNQSVRLSGGCTGWS